MNNLHRDSGTPALAFVFPSNIADGSGEPRSDRIAMWFPVPGEHTTGNFIGLMMARLPPICKKNDAVKREYVKREDVKRDA
jgi:hypothetical protein